jgi:pimeloyl-ACP methyl ester carboxylesterase
MEEKLKIKNSKGQQLSAVIHIPEIKTNKLAILCPGFLDSKDYNHLVELAKDLASIGYTVVRFDPTGTWESEGEISEYLTSQYLNDIQSVLEYMLQKDNYDYVLLGGHSRGGKVALLYAARDPRVSLVVAIMPSSSPYSDKDKEEWEVTGFKISKRDIPQENEYKEFKLPYKHVIDREQFDIVEDIKKIKVPIVMLAGELDTTVSLESVERLFQNASQPKKFFLVPNVTHDYRLNMEEVKIVNDIIISSLKVL